MSLLIDTRRAYAGAPPPRRVAVPNGVLAMLIFVAMEVMFFAGLVSAFIIVRASALSGWPPPGQPLLPAWETLINTIALLLSGVALYVANRCFVEKRAGVKRWLLVSILLGAFFVVFQGGEWLSLLREGLTLTSSHLGSFFYLIIGSHALHAVVALGVLLYTYRKLVSGKLDAYTFWPAQVFWYFVVGLWPFLYWQVYW